MLTPFPGNADICVHLRTSADICVHSRSLKNCSVLGPHFLCAGTVIGSPTCQNPRAHRSNLIPSKVVVPPARNDCFLKNTPFNLRETHFRKMDGLMMAHEPGTLVGAAREARTVNVGFGRSRIHAGFMKIMEIILNPGIPRGKIS